MTGAGRIPTPSDDTLIRLASIAAHVEKLMALDSPVEKPTVGLTTVRNDRRRTVEAILVMLADAEVRDYLTELERLGVLTGKR